MATRCAGHAGYTQDDPWLSLLQAAILIAPENGMTRWARRGIERLMFLLGTPSFQC